MLPASVLDSRGRLQYLHLPGQRQEGRGQMHTLSMPSAIDGCGKVLTQIALLCRRWLKHMHVPIEWLEERYKLHSPALSDTSSGADNAGAHPD